MCHAEALLTGWRCPMVQDGDFAALYVKHRDANRLRLGERAGETGEAGHLAVDGRAFVGGQQRVGVEALVEGHGRGDRAFTA